MTKFTFTLLILTAIALSACSEEAQPPQGVINETASSKKVDRGETQKIGAKLELAWETSGFNNPESVVYHEPTDTLFVSSINGSPVEKDGNGYISKVLLDGTMQSIQWIVGLNAPKGLAIYKDSLYVSDIDTLVEIDIPSGTIINRYKVDDAKFLNDVTASEKGEIFVSDMVLNRIHRLSNDQFDLWLESPELENPNGLHAEEDSIILGAWGVMTDGFATEIPGHLKSISLKDKTITSLGGAPIGNLDGVESDGKDGYFVTDWMAGKLFQINTSGEATLLLELEQGMADHEVLLEHNLILIPMMKNDKLLAYKIK